MFDPEIFKAYDVRGTYPQQLNEDVARAVGRAFAVRAKAREIVVGSDMRLSSPALRTALMQGITEEGVNVRDIGLVPIDAVYAAVGVFGAEAGVMVTASHNPKDDNGFKMVLHGMHWVRGTDIREDVEAAAGRPPAVQHGTVREEDIMPKYVQHVLSFVNVKKIKPLRVVIDAGNGMAGKVIPLLAPSLPITVVPLNFALDGNFPGHPSNPLLPESQRQISEAVVVQRADFGVIFDGDTDRLVFFDERGRFIRADVTLLILAKLFLEQEPGAAIVYNAICSRSVPEFIGAWGGTPIRSKVGYANTSAAMRLHNAIMSGEVSSHYGFRKNANADSGFIAFVILLEELSRLNQKLSEVVAPLAKYAKGDEVNITVDDRTAAVAKVKTAFSDGKQDELDGVTVNYPDWWFNVRPSNTEPLLRVICEAKTEPEMEKHLKEVLDVLK